MITWWIILTQKECSHCGKALKSVCGLSRAFCPFCTASLPAVLSMHLDRAMHGKWFLAYWRTAMKFFRMQKTQMPAALADSRDYYRQDTAKL